MGSAPYNNRLDYEIALRSVKLKAKIKTERDNEIEHIANQDDNGAGQRRSRSVGNSIDKEGAATEQNKKKSKPLKWTLLKISGLVSIASILVVLGTIYLVYSSHHETTDDAYTTGHLHYISSRVAGTVVAVLVDDNQHIEKGQMLVKLDTRDYQVTLDQALANSSRSRTNDFLLNMEKGNGAISKQDYEQSHDTLLVDNASLEDASNQLSYCAIYAPTEGYVGNKTVETGNRVEIGGALMVVVQDAWVLANYKETQIGHMSPGQKATIHVDAIPDHTFYGWVDSFSPGSGTTFALLPSDNATGNFTKIVQRVPVKIVFDRESTRGYESRIVPGLSAIISVDLKSVAKGQGLLQNQQIHDDQQSHLQQNEGRQ